MDLPGLCKTPVLRDSKIYDVDRQRDCAVQLRWGAASIRTQVYPGRGGESLGSVAKTDVPTFWKRLTLTNIGNFANRFVMAGRKFSLDEIANQNLKASDIPSSPASWDQIKRFAGSFNAYTAAEADRYWRLASQTRMDFLEGKKLALDGFGLSELRAIVFLNWRALRHTYCGAKPSPQEMAYVLELIEAIRSKVVE